MKKLSFLFLFAFVTLTLSSFTPIDGNKNITHTAAVAPTGTALGYIVEGNYVFTFFADLSKPAPQPITYIEVSSATTGLGYTVVSYSGTVRHWKFLQYQINGTASVQFYDGSTLVSKDLTGVIQGGILP